MIFASEVPVISALNPYRKIEEVFLNVWSRTHPSQVVDLREQLSLPSTSPEEKLHAVVQELGAAEAIQDLVHEASKAETIDQVAQAQAKVVHSLPPTTPAKIKAEVVDLVTATMYKGFGVKHETNCIEQYAARRQLVVKDQNLVFSKKKVATIATSTLFVGGKIDGRTDQKVIEVKNRVKRFLTPLPKYDIAQLQTYLYILGVEEGELVEQLCTTMTQTKMTKVSWDETMWKRDIEPYLIRFGAALIKLMEDKRAQSAFLLAEGEQQREILRYLWSQDV
ncbi:hypothetical protein PsorP6_006489 [Peronosclerospora sorghi]|uniref:Uncharacterized protein n=1 Tax=Peronosclerospora sorghi TaxID=230839 RepID=A0ACC0W4F2_9STRA|nr:hypothetical protein PsorP6_006489 [Peronosclerospora sorghi]